MTDILLAFATDYGLYVVSVVVFLAALGIPLPASILVLTSGGLAATGDLSIIELFIWTFTAFVIGDQTAYQLGKVAGPGIFDKLSTYKRVGPVVLRSEIFYQKYGLLGILLSRTVASPLGPYVSYICGAWSMSRMQYTITALIGAGMWVLLYITIGYTFAGSVPEISSLMSSVMLVGVAILFSLGFGLKLALSWRAFKNQQISEI